MRRFTWTYIYNKTFTMVAFLAISVLVIAVLWRAASHIWHKELLDGLGKRYVLITGCDSGFGQLIAKKLDTLGVHVFATCLTKKGELHLRQKCSKKIKALHLDITDDNSIAELVRYVEKSIPKDQGLWGLVNNAGVQVLSAPMEWHTKEDYHQTLAVNLFGPIQLTTALLPLLRRSGGRVVNLSGNEALLARPGVCPYNISKSGIEAFTDTFRREMYHSDVTAHLIQPGSFRTNRCNADKHVKLLLERYDSQPTHIKEFYGRSFVSKWRKKLILAPYTDSRDIRPVTDSVTHALFAIHPRYRYRVGFDCRYKVWLLSLMPEFISDWYLAFPTFNVSNVK